MQHLIKEIEADGYHSVKFCEMQMCWAWRGIMESGFKEDDGQEHLRFKVHLD